MKALTREWARKAEGDYNSALRELRARKLPNYDAACFHAQQSVEKYLKARLQEEAIGFTKTHDLVALLDLLLKREPTWLVLRPRLKMLNAYAVAFRYPGNSANKAEAKAAIATCRSLRAVVRVSLGLRP